MTDQPPKILVVIPAYNEAGSIASVVAGALAHFPVLVVDDGSADGTAPAALAAGAFLVRQERNQGKGAALRTGFRWALDQGYDAVLTLDADGQHDPAEIPGFLAAYSQRAVDLVIGARDFSQMPFVRRLSNNIGRWSFSWAMRRPIQDNQSGYRLLSRRMLEAVLDSGQQGFEFEVEMITVCVQRGFVLAWVPIRTIYAGEKSHINPWRHTVNWIRLVWQTRRAMRPVVTEKS